MSLFLEKWTPLTLSIIIAAISVYLPVPFPSNADALSLFGAAATVASVFASFLGVCKAIILTMKDGRTFQTLRENGHTDLLFSYLASGIRGAVIFAGLSILGFFVLPITVGPVLYGYTAPQIFKVIWVWSGLYSLLAYVRIGGIMFKLLKQA